MPEFVRVKDKETGHHYSVSRERYDRSPELWDRLKSPAVDAAGAPLPMKPRTSVSTEAAKRSADKPAESTSE